MQKTFVMELESSVFLQNFALLFALTSMSFITDIDILGFLRWNFLGIGATKIIAVIEIEVSCLCFFPKSDISIEVVQVPASDRKLAKRTIVAMFLIL